MHLFRNKASFYGKELLAPRPTPKLEDRLFLALRDCLFNIQYLQLPCIMDGFPPPATWGRASRATGSKLTVSLPLLRKTLCQFFVQVVHPLKHCLSTTIRLCVRLPASPVGICDGRRVTVQVFLRVLRLSSAIIISPIFYIRISFSYHRCYVILAIYSVVKKEHLSLCTKQQVCCRHFRFGTQVPGNSRI